MRSGYLFIAGLLLTGCVYKAGPDKAGLKPTVCTVNYPLAYFAERIAGDQVELVFPEMDGDPAFWEPKPAQVSAFQKADLILLNGADYAKWIPAASLPQDRTVNTAAGLEADFIALDGTGSHAHGAGGAHVHGDIAFTLWLNPELAMQQAEAVYEALSPIVELREEALGKLIADLEELDTELAQVFQSLEDRPLLGSHPVYQYLAARYNLTMESVHWEPDSEPDQAMWRELEDILETHQADVMFWEDEPLPQVKKALAGKGIKSVVFNPCGNRPDDGDFMTVMHANLAAVKTIK
ncbi:metal ABC transporter substrate-binding protein [Pontiella agarivorans]|uniref:Metal ABC transporter substrate-binding protein n=1 Tax=Pontiella agarivorans TaxID=3038953 RepID=A0ABU5MZ27_9BACT|nr:metal ABC transporter substrate-binding protein [Pontiella agarivorans]MDZ8119453.1 metal ABC transporter substrate-binding protein [Pontiella agarivorans]